MKFIILSTLLFSGVLAVGCASGPQDATQSQPAGEVTYRIGSNIPVRDKTPLTKEEKDKQAAESVRALQLMQATGTGTKRTGTP